ncbi:hypothetical protein LXL04_019585 [Taraxacum kok-saghyz]
MRIRRVVKYLTNVRGSDILITSVIGETSRRAAARESRSFENSYIPENPRTPKPLTFSKNRLRGAKNRSNISPIAKNFFRKNDFFFSKNFAYMQTFFLCICAQFFVLLQNRSKTQNFFKFFYRSLYNTYLKSCTYAQKIKKSCTYAKVKKKYRFFGNFFQRIVMIKNVLEGSEVGLGSGEKKIIFGEKWKPQEHTTAQGPKAISCCNQTKQQHRQGQNRHKKLGSENRLELATSGDAHRTRDFRLRPPIREIENIILNKPENKKKLKEFLDRRDVIENISLNKPVGEDDGRFAPQLLCRRRRWERTSGISTQRGRRANRRGGRRWLQRPIAAVPASQRLPPAALSPAWFVGSVQALSDLPRIFLSVSRWKKDLNSSCSRQGFIHRGEAERGSAFDPRERERERVGSFENSYILENLRTSPISYISQIVIHFKKPTSRLFKISFRIANSAISITSLVPSPTLAPASAIPPTQLHRPLSSHLRATPACAGCPAPLSSTSGSRPSIDLSRFLFSSSDFAQVFDSHLFSPVFSNYVITDYTGLIDGISVEPVAQSVAGSTTNQMEGIEGEEQSAPRNVDSTEQPTPLNQNPSEGATEED